MKNLLKYFVVALAVGLVFYGLDAFAAGGTNTESTNVFQKAIDTLVTVFLNVRKVVYVIGAFGLIGIAIGGIVGKVNFKWLGYLAAGLAIVAVADLFIQYVADVKSSSTGVGDTATINWGSDN